MTTERWSHEVATDEHFPRYLRVTWFIRANQRKLSKAVQIERGKRQEENADYLSGTCGLGWQMFITPELTSLLVRCHFPLLVA
jgi:hypothetical protein